MNALAENKKSITTAELRNMGCSYYKIGKLEKEGVLRRVNRSAYENLFYKGNENDFFSAEAFVPNGVICLMSAARHYELTDFLPDSVEVAIERKNKVATLPDRPEIRIFHFCSARMDLGVTEVRECNNVFHIFDIEKTVADIICYRNKIGIEETSEVLRNYLRRRDRKIDKLYAHAKRLRREKILRTYLEVLL